MFELFTDRARKTMNLAKQAAQRLEHPYIGTEHILFGILDEGSGVAANVMRKMRVDLKRVRDELEREIASGSPSLVTQGNLPFTPAAKAVLESSLAEAQRLNHQHIGTEHLLLGLLGEGQGIAGRVLTRCGLTLAATRREVMEFVGDSPARESRLAVTIEQLKKASAGPMGRVSLELAMSKAAPASVAAALTPPQRDQAATILQKRIFAQLASWPADRITWTGPFEVATDEHGHLTSARAKALIEQHFKLPDVVVDEASAPASDRELGLHFSQQSVAFSLRFRDAIWWDEISLDGITVSVPIEVKLTWTIPYPRRAAYRFGELE
ncbi:MAG: Clp protease N-terminal domain-containing protein [Planctomycetota bacterium]